MLDFKHRFLSCQSGVAMPSLLWRIKIVMACFRTTIPRGKSHTFSNNSLSNYSPMLSPFNQSSVSRLCCFDFCKMSWLYVDHHIWILISISTKEHVMHFSVYSTKCIARLTYNFFQRIQCRNISKILLSTVSLF